MKTLNFSREGIALWLIVTISVILIFQVSYGLGILVPSNNSWLMTVRHDWGTHYLGWAFYKNEPWHFPIGKIINYNYPVGTNVGFTDSIPLFAIFFKLLRPLLNDNFQYFGIWLLLCHLLSAYYTVLLFRLFKINTLNTILAAIFVASTPVLLYRGMHPALCAQWLLIAAIYVYFLSAYKKPQKILIYQFFLLFLSASINPYLCGMVFGFTLITPIKLLVYDKKLKIKYFLVYLIGSIFCLLLLWYIIGFIDFQKKEELGVGGAYGLYSLNLNSLYNPAGYSSILPQLKQVSLFQYEGYMYLGLGLILLILLLIPISLLNYIKDRSNRKGFWFIDRHKSLIPLFILSLVYTIFSVTLVVTLNDKILFKIPAPSLFIRLEEIFRACSRFFWLPYYLIILFTLIVISKARIKPFLISIIFIAALSLQFYDIRPLLTSRTLTYGNYNPPMNIEAWEKLMNQFDEIIFIPPFQAPAIRYMDYQDFSYLAFKAKRPVNLAYVARSDDRAIQLYIDSVTMSVDNGKISPKALYITNRANLKHFDLAIQLNLVKVNYLDSCFYIYSTDIDNKIIDSISQKVNSINKLKLDNTLEVEGKRNEFVDFPKLSPSDKLIHFNMESKIISDTFIKVHGWAFIDTTQDDKKDSIFFSLTSPDHFYIAKSQILARPDVTTAFSKKNLDSSGYNILAFMDNVSKGVYRLGIVIKTQKGEYVYQPLENEVKVKFSPYAQLTEINHLPPKAHINFDINLTENKTEILIAGWAALAEKDADNSIIKVR